MPWPKAHKQETRERIVAAAAAAFREGGISDVGVAQLMDRAGLTHGGFYAHFTSKDEIVAEAFAHAAAQTREQMGGSHDALAYANKYLSETHAAHPERGCPLAAMGSELVRGSARVRRALAANLQKRLEQLYALVSASSAAQRRWRAAGALACMVGGLTIARGLSDAQREEFLADCRAFLKDTLED